jgi:hypothetical protein
MEEMNIVNAKYFKDIIDNIDGIKATINGEVLSVPLDPNNRHYAEILRQVEAGTLTIADAE